MRPIPALCLAGCAALAAPAASAEEPALVEGIEISGDIGFGVAYAPIDANDPRRRAQQMMRIDATIRVSRQLDNGLTVAVEFDVDEDTLD